jgi:hypothetical protein
MGRLETVYRTETRRDTDATAAVAAQRNRDKPGGDGIGGAG